MLIDQSNRDNILVDEKSIVVSASAGSGKTTIMVKKMGIELERIKDHKTIAAITFTVKATGEIKRKAGTKFKKPFVAMTNDAFIENEIIRPFIVDAYGREFKKDYQVEYINRYKFNKFEVGVDQLKNTNILGSFEDSKQNFNFRLALSILERSLAAREYIKSKYSMIFIDEYQDCDYDMHLFFMKLKNELNIKLFIVGDSKQAIYLWRGAMSNIFHLLSKEDFNCYELVTNFRCDEEIENYANLFHNPQNFRMPNSEFVGNVILKKYDALSNSFAARNFEGFLNEFRKIIEDGTININKEITIIANVNSHAIKITELLNEAGYNFMFIPRTPIDEGLPNGYLLKELALYVKNKSYTTYDFLENTYIDERKQTRIEVDNIIKKLKKVENIIPQSITKIVKKLGNYLGISIGDHEVEKFCESVCNNRYDMAFRLTEEKHKVMTVFASKGLEFDQVLSFARYYAIYLEENLQNHYVCVTRAKEKFLMFVDNDNYFDHLVEVANAMGIKDITKLIRYDEKLLTKTN